MFRFHYASMIMYNWLVVWNIFYFPIYWEQLTIIFQRGGPTTNQIMMYNAYHDRTPLNRISIPGQTPGSLYQRRLGHCDEVWTRVTKSAGFLGLWELSLWKFKIAIDGDL